MAVIHSKIAVAISCAASSAMPHNGLWRKPAHLPSQPQSEAHIEILTVAEKILVEAPDSLELCGSKKRRRSTWGKNSAWREVQRCHLAQIAASPGQAAEVVLIADSISQCWVFMLDLKTSKGRRLGMASRRFHQGLQPLRIGKGIGIERGKKFGSRPAQCEVVAAGEAQIAACPQDFNARSWLAKIRR